ncbi:MAG: RNA polymerase sigma factor [Prolixibacteraceae bacterium]
MVDQKEKRFKEILEENGSSINRICRYYCHNQSDLNDMYQEVLVNIWKSLDQFRGDSTISTWIYRIAVNTSISFSGKAYRNMKLYIDNVPQGLNALLDEDDLEQKFQKEQQLEQLEICLNELSIIDKAMISLVLEGLSLREIADVVGLTEPNVKVKIHRVKEQLKQKLIN